MQFVKAFGIYLKSCLIRDFTVFLYLVIVEVVNFYYLVKNHQTPLKNLISNVQSDFSHIYILVHNLWLNKSWNLNHTVLMLDTIT